MILENKEIVVTYYMQHKKMDNLMMVPINLMNQYQTRL